MRLERGCGVCWEFGLVDSETEVAPVEDPEGARSRPATVANRPINPRSDWFSDDSRFWASPQRTTFPTPAPHFNQAAAKRLIAPPLSLT